jgi:hypothetical protein
MKSNDIILFLFLISMMAGCSRREESIDGSVFIVTQGGENFKLGLVTVSLFDQGQITTIVRTNEINLENDLESLKAKLKKLSAENDDLTQKHNAASFKADSLKQNYDEDVNLAETNAQTFDPTYYWGSDLPVRAEFAETNELESARKTVAKYDDLERQISDLQDQLGQLIDKENNSLEQSTNWGQSTIDSGAIDRETKMQDKISDLESQQSTIDIYSARDDLDNLEQQEAQTEQLQTNWDQNHMQFLKEVDQANSAEKDWEEATNEADTLGGLLDLNQSDIDTTTSQLQNWAEDNQPRIFNGLPEPLMSSKTDADGKFSMQIPKKGDFALVATAQRQVADQTEKYYWFIRIHPDKKPAMQVMLSNDNFISIALPRSHV